MTDKIINTIKSDGVIVMASDTVYGLMCLARSPEAVMRMFVIKGRWGKPGTIIAASIDQLKGLGFDISDITIAEKYWPGPVSVILPASEDLSYLHLGLDSLAVRIPNDESLRSLLEQTGPLATTSANRPGEPTVTTIREAKESFGDAVDLYVDGGVIKGAPSSIIVIENGKERRVR